MFEVLVVISFLLPPTSGRSAGAPAGACESRTPSASGHSATPQMTTAPYSVRFMDGVTNYTYGTPVQGEPDILVALLKIITFLHFCFEFSYGQQYRFNHKFSNKYKII